MIIVMGEMRFAAGEGAKAAPLFAEHARTVVQEDGCELYAFSFDAADPDLVRVSERWASPEALAAHGQAEHQKAFGRALRQFTISGTRIDAWTGDFWRTLIGG
jgi:quinol monooxygenase YgiN